MKLYMLWDMEGVSGLFSREQVWFWEQGVRPEAAEEGRQLLIADISSAVRAALAAGADQVIVTDTHHGGGNITFGEMPADQRATYNLRSRGWHGSEYRWLPGLDSSVDGFLVMGHHARAGTPGAFLPHTNNLNWADFTINGLSVGEMGIEACYAAHWGVPTVVAQADRHGCAEAAAQLPGIVTAETKQAVDHDHASGPSAEQGRLITAEAIREATGRLRARAVKVAFPDPPFTVALRLTDAESAEKIARRPGVERVDQTTVRSVIRRRADVLAWISGDGTGMTPREPAPKAP